MRGVHYRLLQWAVGIFCVVIGAMMLVVPHQFNTPIYVVFQPHLDLWGVLFLMAGVMLLMAVVFAPGRLLLTAAHVFAGGLLLLFAYQLARTQAWSATANYVVLGLGVLAVPLWAGKQDRRQDRNQQGRVELFGLIIGLTGMIDGLLSPILYNQLTGPSAAAIRSMLPAFAVAGIVAGLIMIAVQFYPTAPTWVRLGAYVLLGSLTLLWIIESAAPVQKWVGYVWYGEFGILLICAPWLQSRLPQPSIDSLRVRLALALVLVAAIPLMIQAALITSREGDTATDQALTFQQRLVTSQSQHIASYVDLYRSAVAAFAAQPGLLTMTPDARQRVVQAFKQAYPDTMLVATYDAAGNVLTRSDGLSSPALTALDIYQMIRTTNKPGLQITMARTYKRLVFVFGAPIQDAAGQFTGIALFSVDTARLNDLLKHANVDGNDTLYLVDAQGHVIVHPDDALVQAEADLSQRPPVARLLAEQASGSMIYTPSGGDAQVVAYAPVPGVGWGVIAERPLSITMTGIWSGRDIAFALLALLAATDLLIGSALARNLTAPLWNVANAMNRWTPDNVPVLLNDSGHLAEISLLTTAFNDLQQRLADRTAERDRAERTLRDERERLQVTLTSIGDAVIVTDAAGQVTFMNPVAESLTGWTEPAAASQPLPEVFQIVNEVTRQPVENPAGKVLRDHTVAGLANHTILLAKDGREIPIDDSGAPILDVDGGVIGVILVFRDITQRRQAERQIAAAYAQADADRRRLEAVLEALPVGVTIADSSGAIIKYNKQIDLIWYGIPPVADVEGYRQYRGWWADSGRLVEPGEWALPRAALGGETVVDQIITIERFDGQKRTIINSGAPIRDEQGQLIGGVVAVQDITALKQVEQALAESEQRFRAAIDNFPDAFIIYDAERHIQYVNARAAGNAGWPEDKCIGCRDEDLYPPEVTDQYVPWLIRAISTRTQQTVEITLPDRLGGATRLINYVPLRDEHGTVYRVLGIMLDITARKRAENNLRFLVDAGTLLSSSLDYETLLQRLPGLIVPRFADYFTLDAVGDNGQDRKNGQNKQNGQTLQRLAVGASNPDSVAVSAGDLPDPWMPHVQAVRESQMPYLIADIPDQLGDPAVGETDALEHYRRIGSQSVMIVPLILGDRTIGILSLGMADSGRRFTQDDLEIAGVLASRISIVLENARLYQAERQARALAEKAAEQITQLQAITAALSGALTPQRVAEVILNQGLAAVDSVAGTIALRVGDFLQIVYSTGYTAEQLESRRLLALDTSFPIAEVVLTGSAIWLETPEQRAARYPSLPSYEVALGRAAWAVVPLKLNGRVLGSMTLSFATERQFSAEDKALILALAEQCAQALERANLYDQVRHNAKVLELTVQARTEELRQAVKRAESADRAKMVMLATVTHEMRTPLSSIVGFSRLLLKRDLDAEKVHTFTSAIHSEGRRLARLIDDFLDLQRIDSGREVFHFDRLDLAALIDDVIAKTEVGDYPLHTLCVNLDPVSPVYADSDRIRQVLVNLLSNAVKYSPEGSQVTLALRQEGDHVLFSIQDQGLGIPPGDLSILFERFKRGEIAEELRIQGTGLGLALCKEIIQAHHGRIWAESDGPNEGSTFYFSLPLA